MLCHIKGCPNTALYVSRMQHGFCKLHREYAVKEMKITTAHYDAAVSAKKEEAQVQDDRMWKRGRKSNRDVTKERRSK